jgi:hypothetical protein
MDVHTYEMKSKDAALMPPRSRIFSKAEGSQTAFQIVESAAACLVTRSLS